VPTERQHGGAAIAHIPLTVPGFKGLNTQQASSLLGPEWATNLRNCVIDDSSRVAARKGFDVITTSEIAADPIIQLYELVESTGDTELIAFTDADIWKSTDGAAWTSINGTLTITDGNWKAVNFNDTMVAAQAGEAPIEYTGTGDFTEISDVNAPTGGIILSAYGRIWLSDSDGHTIKYSALLDASDWTSTDSGSLDLWNIWPDNDEITGIAAFNSMLFVFGRRTIVAMTDGQGSPLGVDPTQMYVVDVLKGTGCLTQDSIQHVDGDLWFLSENGLQSLSRVIQERSNPLNNLSKNVQDYLSGFVATADLSLVRSAYSSLHRVYLLALPGGTDAETGTVFVFDTRGLLEDGAARCVGQWTLVPRAMVVTRDQVLLMQVFNADGIIGRYYGGIDDGESYTLIYESGWMDLTQAGYILLPKRYEGVFYCDNTVTVTFKWAFDFNPDFKSISKTFTGSGAGGEWGEAEWGEDEFGGGVSLRRGKVAPYKSGEYIKLGISAVINNAVFAIQSLDLFAKIGRYQ